MRKQTIALLTLILLAGLLNSGCTLIPDATENNEEVRIQSTEESVQVTELESADTLLPEENEMESAETTEAVAESTSETVEIIHQVLPGNPVYTQSLPSECNTGFNFGNPGYSVKAPCDSWPINLLERPVSADLSEFYHYLDILDAKAGQAGDWVYFRIDLFGAGIPADESTLTYYFELDGNQDGRGDFLVAVTNQDLYNTEWSSAGVRVYQDQNLDVGGMTPIRPDSTTYGDGYDTILLDEGLGDDPDLAFARRNPSHYNQIEFAIKKSLLENGMNFMWWAGAMLGDFQPQSFDLVDNTTEDTLYPIDTTCGWIMGQEMTYNIRKCYIAPEPTARPSTSSSPAEEVCIQPPHPDPQNNCWYWVEEDCEWICIN